VYVYPRDLHRFLLCVEAAERTRKRLHTVTCYDSSYSEEWRDTDWFKTRVPDQTQKRPRFIQSANRSSPSTLQQRTRTLNPIFMSMGWAPGPCVTHNPKVGGSNPPPATNLNSFPCNVLLPITPTCIGFVVSFSIH